MEQQQFIEEDSIGFNHAQKAERAHSTGSMSRPMQLGTIELAYYILKLVKNGVTAEDLCKCLEGEYSLVWAYLRLFDEMKWIEKHGDKWILTDAGAANISRFQGGGKDVP